MEEQDKVFEFLHIIDVGCVELASYKLKGIAKINYEQWKKISDEEAPIVSWIMFESAFVVCFFPHYLWEENVRKFLHEDNLKFTQLSHFATWIVAKMRINMSLFFSLLSRLSSK